MMPESASQRTRPSDCDFQTILEPPEETGMAIDLDHLSVISITGEDSEQFVQNQFSNDLRTLDPPCSQLHAYCNPKGRTLAVIRLLTKPSGGFRMLVPASMVKGLEKRLKMFVLRSRVVLTHDETEHVLGTTGTLPLPDSCTGLSTHTCKGHVPRTLVVGNRDQTAECLKRADPILHGDFWKLADILSGIPQVYPQTTETFIPQHLNLDLVDGISFRKGCYPGQEIIARLRYLGKSKQRLCIATVQHSGDILPGTDLVNPVQPEQRPGKVVDAARTAPDVFHLSAVVPVSDTQPLRMCLGSAEGPEIAQIPLPYPLPDTGNPSGRIDTT